MHALIISPFIWRDLPLSFYANETTSSLHGRPCRDLYPQCFNNPETVTTVTSRVESEHNKTNTTTCALSEYIISLSIRKVWSVFVVHQKKGTHIAHSEDSDQTGWMLKLMLFLSGRTVCHAPDYCWFPLTIINTLSFHWKATYYCYTKGFAM